MYKVFRAVFCGVHSVLPDSSIEISQDGQDSSIRRVLVVDDSRLQRRILVASLKKWGFEVVEAESGEAAMEICLADPPDLILSDWMMPGMNGLDGLRAVLAMEQTDRVALISGEATKKIAEDALAAGAAGFVPKSLPAKSLVNAVKFMAMGEQYAPIGENAEQVDQADLLPIIAD